MDLNQAIQLATDPRVRRLLQSLLAQSAGWPGLMSRLRRAGLGDQVGSWLSTGPNRPVTGQQMRRALGPGIDQAASAAGLSPDEAANDVAKVMPSVVDGASPNGHLDMNALQDILKQLTGAKAG